MFMQNIEIVSDIIYSNNQYNLLVSPKSAKKKNSIINHVTNISSSTSGLLSPFENNKKKIVSHFFFLGTHARYQNLFKWCRRILFLCSGELAEELMCVCVYVQPTTCVTISLPKIYSRNIKHVSVNSTFLFNFIHKKVKAANT